MLLVDWLRRKVKDSGESGKIAFNAVFTSCESPTFKVVVSSKMSSLWS